MGTANGVLLLNKPEGLTSHDVVNRVRRKLDTRRVGHAGTLDPDATGLLVICVGEATRLIEFIVTDKKEYAGTVRFGIGTTTDDASGKTIAQADANRLTVKDLSSSAESFVGRQKQQVPAYSAVHIEGRRAYEYAREERTVDLPVREIDIYALQVLSFRPGQISEADFRTTCSKGTYIRALCRDWGAKLGLPAHLSRLSRLRSGGFAISEATQLEVFEASDNPGQYLLPATEAVRDLPRSRQPLDVIVRLAVGQAVLVQRESISSGPALIGVDDAESSQAVAAVLAPDETLAAMVRVVHVDEPQGAVLLQPKKVFWKRET